MSIIAPVDEKGVITTDLSTTKTTSTTSKDGNSQLGKDDFLQLLVAQMKYQDPLEPTSNTEYISQYATFSELEQMQNVSTSVNLERASNLVGKHVYMKTTNATTGASNYVYGKVDFVQVQNNKGYLSINGSLYPVEDLDSVVDDAYMDAYNKAQDLYNDILKLPTLANVTMEDEKAITAINDTYNGMSDYEKSFFQDTVKTSIDSYVKKLDEVRKIAKEAATDMSDKLTAALKELPALEEITIDHKADVEKANKMYTDMNTYQKGFVSEDTKNLLESYVAKVKEFETESKTDDETTEA